MDNSDDQLQLLQEAIAILNNGVVVTSFENSLLFGFDRTARFSRLLWLDSELFRICIDTDRPDISELSLGKVSSGLYLRDISEIRDGANGRNFRQIKPADDDCCLVLIGSEESYCIEFDSKKNRDWFSISFRLLIDSNQTLEEKSSRKYNIWEHIGTRPAIDVAPQMAARFQGVLKRGLEVIFHQKSGDIIRNAILRISDADGDKADSSLTLQFVDNKNWLGIWSKPTILTLPLYDISEIREGSHSFGFVKTRSTHLYSVTLSIIGSENVFDLEFVNTAARDMFAERLFDLLRRSLFDHHILKKQTEQRLELMSRGRQQTVDETVIPEHKSSEARPVSTSTTPYHELRTAVGQGGPRQVGQGAGQVSALAFVAAPTTAPKKKQSGEGGVAESSYLDSIVTTENIFPFKD